MAPPPVEEPVESPLSHLAESTPASRILVVDDNEDVAISFGALLDVLGHDVRVVLDGHMALDVVRDFMPHIVFLDIAMPDMDGYEVARRLRAEHRYENLRLVAVTGYGQDHDSERAQRAGFDHHLLKPVDLKDLQALLGH
jgi:CheY-like chemotaxis protein